MVCTPPPRGVEGRRAGPQAATEEAALVAERPQSFGGHTLSRSWRAALFSPTQHFPQHHRNHHGITGISHTASAPHVLAQ